MNLEKLEQSVHDIVSDLDESEFIYKLLRAYDQPKASITRLRNGQYNQSKNEGEILWKKKLCFRYEPDGDLYGCIDQLKFNEAVVRHKPRFIIVTDFETLLALDTKTEDTISTSINELADHFDFFLPWAGMEKSQIQSESLADIKAAEKMGRLYEIILADNYVNTDEDRHALNIFLSRLLFCFFADDTEIFKPDQFTNAIASHTAVDGSDLQGYLQNLFGVLATEDAKRNSFPAFLREFPYVNGGLFCERYKVPVFNRKSRQIIIECGALNWKAINPDIFGSMIQSVVHTGKRSELGMHYTSVVNIMKVIEPLFLNELKVELERAGTGKKRLDALLKRIYNLRVFDPACGSGNFLIIAYKELCRLEIEIYRRLGQSETGVQIDLLRSNLQLTQFYGIELDDFAHETAKLSLWLAEHQMNLEFKLVFGATRPTLPLQEGGNIVCANATRIDWEEVCPKGKEVEVFVLGNPPYLGQRNQEEQHKADMAIVFRHDEPYKNLDYVCCWLLKASKFIDENSSVAFVATSSICQGRHASLLWPKLYRRNVEIRFAYQTFKWSNSARDNAGVSCVIVGLGAQSDRSKKIYTAVGAQTVSLINSYLTSDDRPEIKSRRKTLSEFPCMIGGNQPREGGHLFLSVEERTRLVDENPEAAQYTKRVVGTNEMLKGLERWCIWIEDNEVAEATRIPEIYSRVEKVREKRTNGNTVEVSFKHMPYRFVQVNRPRHNQIVIPNVSTPRREYLPIDFVDSEIIVTNLAMIILDGGPEIFGVVNSRMHALWFRAVAGRLGEAIRYTVGLCYNTFPFPKLTPQQSEALSESSFLILEAREAFPELSLEQLYDPDTMPESLRQAHYQLDLVVEQCYRMKPFSSDEERLEYLFKLYETMIEEETTANA